MAMTALRLLATAALFCACCSKCSSLDGPFCAPINGMSVPAHVHGLRLPKPERAATQAPQSAAQISELAALLSQLVGGSPMAAGAVSLLGPGAASTSNSKLLVQNITVVDPEDETNNQVMMVMLLHTHDTNPVKGSSRIKSSDGPSTTSDLGESPLDGRFSVTDLGSPQEEFFLRVEEKLGAREKSELLHHAAERALRLRGLWPVSEEEGKGEGRRGDNGQPPAASDDGAGSGGNAAGAGRHSDGDEAVGVERQGPGGA